MPLGQYDFYGVVAHEISEVMGRQMMDGENFAGGTSYEPLDLFHYSAAGVRDFSGTTAGYFSPDGGTTNLGNFNTNPNGDFGDWAGSVGNNSFLAFSGSGVVNPVTANDLTEMNLLGWDPTTSGGAPVVTIALADDTSGGKDITANDALTGTADANATVTISEGSTVLGTATANASGVWSFTPTSLAQGLQTVTASETNAAGLTGSSSLTFTYDTAAPTVTIALADTFANVSVDATTPVVKGHHAHSLLSSSASISASSGVLADASDANPSDVLGVSAVDGSSANVGHSVSGSYGTLTMNPDGGYTYTNTNPSAVAGLGGVTEDSFAYAVSNGHGGTATSELNVLITSPNETYLTGASGSSIKAGNGSVVLDGSAGNMTLTAGSNGTQWLVGGAGDTLNGGKSADTFLFPPNLGNETINNFNVKNDVIDLPHSEFADFAAVRADLHAVGTSVVLTLDATDSITLTHLQIQSLHAQNFHFF